MTYKGESSGPLGSSERTDFRSLLNPSALDVGLELIGIRFLFHFFQFHLYRFNAFVKFARQEIIRVRLQKLLQRSQMGSLQRQICRHFYIWRHARPFPVGSSDGIDRIAIRHRDFKVLVDLVTIRCVTSTASRFSDERGPLQVFEVVSKLFSP